MEPMTRYCYGCKMHHEIGEFTKMQRTCRAYKSRKKGEETAGQAQARLLQQVRLECNLSPAALARAIRVSAPHMEQLAKGRREMSEPKLIKVATMLISKRRQRSALPAPLTPWVSV